MYAAVATKKCDIGYALAISCACIPSDFRQIPNDLGLSYYRNLTIGLHQSNVLEFGAKISGQYCRDMLLIRFWQNNAPALVKQSNFCAETTQFSADSLDLNPVDHHIWDVVQKCVYQVSVWDVDKLRQQIFES